MCIRDRYYTCEYKSGPNFDIVVNYTLDNYITVMGTDRDGNTVHRSGYLINPNNITDNGNSVTVHRINVEKGEQLGEYLTIVDEVKRRVDNADGTSRDEYTFEIYNPNNTPEPEPKYYSYVYYNHEKYYLDPNPNTISTSYSCLLYTSRCV